MRIEDCIEILNVGERAIREEGERYPGEGIGTKDAIRMAGRELCYEGLAKNEADGAELFVEARLFRAGAERLLAPCTPAELLERKIARVVEVR